jgi:hypothetical protein
MSLNLLKKCCENKKFKTKMLQGENVPKWKVEWCKTEVVGKHSIKSSSNARYETTIEHLKKSSSDAKQGSYNVTRALQGQGRLNN